MKIHPMQRKWDQQHKTFTRMAIYGIFNANPNFIRIMEKEDDDDVDDDDADGKKRRCSALEY